MIGDQIISLFDSLGVIGMLAALLCIFLIDSMLFPTVPEFFLLTIYATNPVSEWGLSLIIIAITAISIGNTSLYVFVKKIGIPGFIEKAMITYSNIMPSKNENMLLINRIAPVLPYTGAFIAVNEWNYKKAMLYIIGGGILKFSILIMLSGIFYTYFEQGDAQRATFILIVLTIFIGLGLSYFRKRKIK